MFVKLFILGLPGSGKSTVARYIINQYKDRSIQRINDYDILLEMFRTDPNSKQFSPTKSGGFDVHDFLVCDVALLEIEKRASVMMEAGNEVKLIIIEFARNNYDQAFSLFNPYFLQNAYFLFLEADMDICKVRVQQRVASPQTEDDHDVSEYIFDEYYSKDNGHYLSSRLRREHPIDAHRIKVIQNNGQQEEIREELNQFVKSIFKQ